MCSADDADFSEIWPPIEIQSLPVFFYNGGSLNILQQSRNEQLLLTRTEECASNRGSVNPMTFLLTRRLHSVDNKVVDGEKKIQRFSLLTAGCSDLRSFRTPYYRRNWLTSADHVGNFASNGSIYLCIHLVCILSRFLWKLEARTFALSSSRKSEGHLEAQRMCSWTRCHVSSAIQMPGTRNNWMPMRNTSSWLAINRVLRSAEERLFGDENLSNWRWCSRSSRNYRAD